MSNEHIADFFDRECCAVVDRLAGRPGKLDRTAEELLNALAATGFESGTVIEIGAGDGTLSRELLRRGAQTVTGLDLSPQSVAYASAQAIGAGLGDQLSYRVADAAHTPLEPHDAVISDKVFCCFPDAPALLANTLPAARSHYALVLPESRGLVGRIARLVVGVGNLWQRLRRDPFRGYVHDLDSIDETILAAGFTLQASARRIPWRVLVYSRQS